MGIYSLAVGVWLYLKRTDFYELTPTSFSAFSTAGLCCSTGVAVCIICTVGWIAATAYNRRLLLTYVGFVILLAIIQTVTGVLGLFYKEAAREHVRLDLLHNINRTALVTSQGRVFDLTASWDKLQKSGCFEVFADWLYHHVSVMNWISLTLLFVELSSLAIAVSLVNSDSFFVGSSGKSRDEYHRCLVEMNEIEARDLRVQPMDRIGDARQDPLDNIL
ncbi:tetraspanin family protein [Necator americanus]|uniref:Tetraspanin family protein n=1 Tax=Necator americanus TaxID=51031 RepID=W2STM9_NECAM|nr:tetraspanin family protein [Necator americanus]ETN72057.1 tetraspanin family protein [Necator americanus]